MQGSVKRYSDFNGYGFITGDDGHDYFVHQSNIKMPGYRLLSVGQRVAYDVAQTPKGYQAINVIPSDIASPQDKVELIVEKNPFTPQEPVAIAAKFAGRQREAVSAVRALINGANLLIHGPRGVGKSSFAKQILRVQSGDYELLNRYNIRLPGGALNNLVCSYQCTPGDRLDDIANGLVRALNYSITGRILFPEVATEERYDGGVFQRNVVSTEKGLSLSEIANDFSLIIQQSYASVSNERAGITFLLDEIDVLHKDILIAPFLKAVCESIPTHNKFSFNFILCGVTGTITRLIHEHKSSSRLFDPIQLMAMSDDELTELITLALKGCSKTISNDSVAGILKISNRYPHPAQQLGYFAFEFCNTGVIVKSDVENAIKHIVTIIKDAEYSLKLSSYGESFKAKVLKHAASMNNDEFTFNLICDCFKGCDEGKILSALINLQKEEVLDKDSRGRKTIYSFREPLFKEYVRWSYQID